MLAQKQERKGGEKTLKYSLFGALSGTTARTVTAPLERLRILLEVNLLNSITA